MGGLSTRYSVLGPLCALRLALCDLMWAVGNGCSMIVSRQERVFGTGITSPDCPNPGFLLLPLSLTQSNGVLHRDQFVDLSLVKSGEGVGSLMDHGHGMGSTNDKGGEYSDSITSY